MRGFRDRKVQEKLVLSGAEKPKRNTSFKMEGVSTVSSIADVKKEGIKMNTPLDITRRTLLTLTRSNS